MGPLGWWWGLSSWPFAPPWLPCLGPQQPPLALCKQTKFFGCLRFSTQAAKISKRLWAPLCRSAPYLPPPFSVLQAQGPALIPPPTPAPPALCPHEKMGPGPHHLCNILRINPQTAGWAGPAPPEPFALLPPEVPLPWGRKPDVQGSSGGPCPHKASFLLLSPRSKCMAALAGASRRQLCRRRVPAAGTQGSVRPQVFCNQATWARVSTEWFKAGDADGPLPHRLDS